MDERDHADPERPPDPEDNPFDRVVGPWQDVVEDMTATAERYRADGWETVELHPGDVAVLTGDPRTMAEEKGDFEPGPRRLGLDVVVPGEEYERLRDLASGRTFDSYEAFRAVEGGIVFLLVVVTDATDEVAVFVPAYYELADAADLREVADEHAMYTHVRSLSPDEAVTFTHDDPDPLFPDAGTVGGE